MRSTNSSVFFVEEAVTNPNATSQNGSASRSVEMTMNFRSRLTSMSFGSTKIAACRARFAISAGRHSSGASGENGRISPLRNSASFSAAFLSGDPGGTRTTYFPPAAFSPVHSCAACARRASYPG